VLGLVALIGLLAMLQSGQLSLGSVLPAPAAGTRHTKAGARSKTPQFLPRTTKAVSTTGGPAAEQSGPATYPRQPRRELYQALAQMDADAAANMLMELDADRVTELLLQLRERELARILEAAPPFESAQWVADLLDAAPPLDLPPAASQLPTAADSTAIPGTNDSSQNTSDSTSSPAESPQDGAATSEAPVDDSNAAGSEPLQLPPDTNTA
jgi:hypothetical protein